MTVSAQNKAGFVDVDDESRGKSIKARRLAHGIKSVRAFAEASGVSREAITAAEEGTASEGTYARLEAWLNSFEEEIGLDAPPAAASQLVTFRLSGNFGVDVVVSGPVSDIDKLKETVQDLMRSMGRQDEGDSK